MAIHITQSDIKTNVLILHTFCKRTADTVLAGAAERLIALFSTQLNDKSRGDLIAAGMDLNAYVAKFDL